jgi:hypothetical protein
VAYAKNVVTIIVRMVKVIPQIWNVTQESSIVMFVVEASLTIVILF